MNDIKKSKQRYKLRGNNKLGTTLYIIGVLSLSLFRTAMVTTLTELPIPNWIFQGIPFVLFYSCIIFKILFINRYTKNQLIWFSVLFAYSITNYVVGGFFVEPITIPLIIIGAMDIDFRKLFITYFWSHLFFIFIIIILWSMKIIPSWEIIGNNGRVRYGLGFNNCNRISGAFFCLFLLYSMFFEKKTVLYYIFALFLLLFAYFVTYTRTIIVLTFLTVSLFFIFSNIKRLKENKWILYSLVFFLIFICITSFIISYYYKPSSHYLNKLNRFLSGRIEIAHWNIEHQRPSLFGSNYKNFNYADVNSGKSTIMTVIDNSYLFLFYRFGCIALILVIVGFTLFGIKAVKYGFWYYTLIIFISSLLYFSENIIIETAYTPFICLIGMLFCKNANCMNVMRQNSLFFYLKRKNKNKKLK